MEADEQEAKGGFKFDITDITDYIPMKLTILRPGETILPWKVRFKDIAGMTEAKREVVEFVDYLQKPSKLYSVSVLTDVLRFLRTC